MTTMQPHFRLHRDDAKAITRFKSHAKMAALCQNDLFNLYMKLDRMVQAVNSTYGPESDDCPELVRVEDAPFN